MTKRNSRFLTIAMCAAGLFGACGDDDDGTSIDVDGGVTIDASGTEFVCDPEGANPAMGALLNAPLEDGVEVVTKEPQHPGDPGPTDLP